jgi:hypothetical protein
MKAYTQVAANLRLPGEALIDGAFRQAHIRVIFGTCDTN